jgi:hypothetical protein
MRAVIFPEGLHWIGQCIERDICVQALTLPKVRKRLSMTVSMESSDTRFTEIPRSPGCFEQMWDEGIGLRHETKAA